MESIETLGSRICIIGLSAGGKSTLAQALGKKLNLKVFHLDQMAHRTFTNWKEENPEVFRQKHQQILALNNAWIIEGNYSHLIPERFEQATSVIWLDFSKWGSVYRYLKRTLKNESFRPGNLKGANDKISLNHIYYTLFKAPKNRKVYQRLIDNSNVKSIRITSFKELMNYYTYWNLYN